MLNYPILGRALSCVLAAALVVARTAGAQDTASAPRAELTDSAVVADSVRVVARWLVANGAPERRAHTVAAHVVEFARRRALDPLLVVGVIGVENAELAPRARSRAGARGVMQVMPSWKRDVRDCRGDIHDLRVNICLGTAVLRIALDASESVREALLRYNGCVKAPGCGVYASAVLARVGNALIATRQPATKRVSVAEGGEAARER